MSGEQTKTQENRQILFLGIGRSGQQRGWQPAITVACNA
jgi:hypothetical protein